jgi:hypothetical protein
MKVNDLAAPVKAIADPQERGRQYLATFVSPVHQDGMPRWN